jgi:cell division protein FtsL
MNTRNAVYGALSVALSVAVMITFVWKGWRAQQLAMQLDALKSEQRQLLDQQDKLRTQATALSHAARIKDIVSTRLGLVEPAQPPIDVPAIAPMGSPDSLAAIRATGTEIWRGKANKNTPSAQ